MRKTIIALLACTAALTTQAITQIAFDDFSGGTSGTTLSGTSDDYGYTWSIARNDRDVVFGPDGQSVITTNDLGGGALLGGDFSKSALTGNVFQASLILSPNGNSTNDNGKMTIGFFNTVDKGYLENLNDSAAPLVAFRFFFTDHPNQEGRMSWNVRDGVSSTTTYAGTQQELTDNAYTMVITYNVDSGEATASVTDSAGVVIASDTTTTSPGLSFTSAGFGWGGTDTTVSNLSSVTDFTVHTYSPVPADEWLNLRNHSLAQTGQINQYLTITGLDARIGVSTNTADPKAHWKIIETAAGSGEYQIVNRWAVQQGIAQSNLWVDAGDSDYVKLSDTSDDSVIWYISENIDTPNQPLDYFIRSKSAFPSNDRLFVNDDQTEAFIKYATGWKASWRLETAPEIDDSITPPSMTVSFSDGSLIISASNMTLGAESTLYSTPTLTPADWNPIGTAITGVSETNWIIAATNNAEFFKVISD